MVEQITLLNTPYSLTQESNFMLSHCTPTNNLSYRSCFADRIIHLKEGSMLLFRHQTNGDVYILVLAPNSETNILSESLNDIGDPQNYSIHLMESNYQMLLRIHR
jgi:hypothetical protein